MNAYVVRRLLVMIPTFFGIALIIFVVLNLAPGKPGAQQSADASKNAKSSETAESARIFREQFGLDRPVLFNTRFTLERGEVLSDVRAASGIDEVGAAERVRAQDRLEDDGAFAVPHLASILRESAGKNDGWLRDATVAFLGLVAKRQLRDPFDKAASDVTRAYNREVEEENNHLRALRYGPEASEDDKRRIATEWLGWFDAHHARFEHSFGDKVRIFFFETRFARYFQNLLRLDFGVSLVTREPVLATMVSKLKYSLTLSVGSLVLSYLIAIPLGIFSAVKKDSAADRGLTLGLFMLYSLPSFFVATLLLYFFSQGADVPAFRVFPTGGWQTPAHADFTTWESLEDLAWHLVLPMFCLTYGSLAALSRYMRSGLLDVIRADYIRTARAKGLSERVVIGKHALRNGLLPILTLLSGLLPAILGGSVIIEYIFGIPGMGLWVVDAIYQRDYNVILVVELFSTLLVLVGLLLTDLSYALVDPRIRYE